MNKRTIIYAILCASMIPLGASAAAVAGLPTASPEAVGINSARLGQIDTAVAEGLNDRNMPGCVVMICRRGKAVFLKAYGDKQVVPERIPMTTDTVFDLASLTKPTATAISVMMLIERGKLRLDDPVAKTIPEFGQNGKDTITVFHLLTHQGGLIPDNPLSDYDDGPAQAWERLWATKPIAAPGEKFVYSDVNYIVLGELVRRASGQDLREFAHDNLFGPLGMAETGYLPEQRLRERAAPTERRNGHWMQGEVHDPRAYLLGGVAGHAGLFSTAADLAVFAQMMLNGGQYDGTRVLSRDSVTEMIEPRQTSAGLRGLGWDIKSSYSSNRSPAYSARAFGHGGFTGTSLWIDPQWELSVIFLSNRLHPDGKGNVNRLAARIGTIAVEAIEDAAPQPENSMRKMGTGSVAHDDIASAERLPPRCLSPFSAAASKWSVTKGDRHRRRRPYLQANRCRGDGASPLLQLSTQRSNAKESVVLTGIDVLTRDRFAPLVGRHVGLITNHTGVNRQGVSTARLLHEAPGVELVALFSPEHGPEGKLDAENIADARDPATGVPIHSLYGKTRKPTAAMLNGIDTLVFDIQDVGARFYTYVSTMGNAMQAAAEHKLRFVVLDRPNPINGRDFAGPLLDAGRESFVGFYRLPVRHGMTVGELAAMFKGELRLDLDLRIVRMEGWRRSDFYDATGLRWINPSPNMRSLTEAILYPGIGLLETTNLSVGRGTGTPFEVVGAPWLDGPRLAEALADAGLPGARFTAITFTPESSKFQAERCQGIRIEITDRKSFEPLRTGLEIACQLHKLHGDTWDVKTYDRLLGNKQVLDALRAGKSVTEIEALYRDRLREFSATREHYLIYGP